MSIAKSPRFAGITTRHWMVVVGSGLLMAMNVLLFLAAGLMLPPLATALGVGLSHVMVFASINFLTGAAVMSAVGGRLIRRFGMRTLIIAGGGFTGTMLFAVSLISSLPALYLVAFASGLLGPVSMQMSGAALINDWFARSQGMMLGLVMAIGGVGGIVAGAVLPQVVAAGGWQLGFQLVGGLTATIAVLIGVFLVRSHPAELGLHPYGVKDTHQAQEHGDDVGLPASVALKSPQFAALIIGLAIFSALMALQQHFPPMMAEHGLDLAAAGSLISVLSLVNVGATLLFGRVTDGRGPLLAYSLSGGLLVLALTLFHLTAGYLPQTAAIVLFSIPAVTPPIITPILFRHTFGPRSFVSLLGVGMATMPAGVALGSPLWGLSKDLTGSYGPGLVIAIGLAVVAFALVAFALVTGPKRWSPAQKQTAQVGA